jgi:site-specific recombinase XerD
VKKFTLPKHPFPGMKVFCRRCRIDNPNCDHTNRKVYRIRVHIPGSDKSVRIKTLTADNYEAAVAEAIAFKVELKQRNYEPLEPAKETGNDYSVIGAILKFNQYLSGHSDYAHLKKDLTDAYREELIRYCRYFADSLKENHQIERMRIVNVSKRDVANFYLRMEKRFHPKSFNKCLAGLKYFFSFLIRVEEIEMKNPFEHYEPKAVPATKIETLTKEEFISILEAVDSCDPFQVLGTGEKKNMYFPWLKQAFKLFLFTGGRREEVIQLKWGDLLTTESGTKLFITDNLKLNRNNRIKQQRKKVFPVTPDFEEFLIELGMNENPDPDSYVLPTDRSQNIQTIMDRTTKAFTHYAASAGIKKKVTLKNLRKTYITWMNRAMGLETGKLTSQTVGVMKDYYLDPKIVALAEKGAREVKIFG